MRRRGRKSIYIQKNIRRIVLIALVVILGSVVLRTGGSFLRQSRSLLSGMNQADTSLGWNLILVNADTSGSSSDAVYTWLDENAYKYGFIKRYPPDKTEITGINNEPWHYRYVGEEAAKEMKDKNLCLEEYIGQLKP